MEIFYINGSFTHKNDAYISVEDRGFNFSDGIYEVISFKDETLMNVKKHLSRLERSLSELKIIKPFKNFKSIELILKRLIKLNKLKKGFVYLQITRGTSFRNHEFPKKTVPNVVFFLFPQKNNDKLMNNGVKVMLSEDLRWKRCDIKSISLLPNILEKQKAKKLNYYEVWQTKKNFITEGSTSNAFIVDSKSRIFTHPKNNNILGGVTRECIVEIAKMNNLSIIEKSFSVIDIKKCKEAFLSSTTVGILPVVKVDNILINNGEIGKITSKLTDLYKNFLEDQI